MKFVIEHMEERLSPWCFWEYTHISQTVGKNNLIFTHISSNKLDQLGTIKPQPVAQLKLKKACLLDPSAKKTLAPADAKKFNYLIFGGILGDFPRKHRTQLLAQQLGKIEKRNLGQMQMSTDNAVLTAKLIIDGTPLEKIPFLDKLEILVDVGESVVLPYRYVLINHRPFISQKIVNYLKKHPL